MDNKLFDQLLESVNQAVEIRSGKAKAARVTTHELPDVRAIRTKVKLKQTDFAKSIGVSASLVQAWEQNKRTPTGSSLKLLKVLEKDPGMIKLFSIA